MNVYLREFQPKDTALFLKLDKQAYPEHIRFTQEQLIDIISHPDVVAYTIINKEEEIIGSVLLKLEKFKNELVLISIVIDESHRNRGIGSKALAAVINIAKHLHVKKICIQVEQTNQKAVDFFKYHHFLIISELEDFIKQGNQGYEMHFSL